MQQRLLVLNYHQVPELADSLRPDQVDRGVFGEQLRTLKRFFNVVDLHDGIDSMRSSDLPPRALAITFDDGYRDNYDVALDELLKAKCPATFFIATDYLDGGRMWNDTLIEAVRQTKRDSVDIKELGIPQLQLDTPLNLSSNLDRMGAIRKLIPAVKYLDAQTRQRAVDSLASYCGVELSNTMMMTSAQVQGLVDAGMSIGGHTSSHPILLKLSLEEAGNDIIRGREALTKLLDQEPRFFAYPNGKLNQDFSAEHAKLLPEIGFDAAFTTQWGYVNRSMPAFELPRVGFNRQTGFKLVLKVLRSFFDAPAEFS
ncbi:MAG: polysaccharide deacetylase family protein [Gammaproteobacteria bacterium]